MNVRTIAIIFATILVGPSLRAAGAPEPASSPNASDQLFKIFVNYNNYSADAKRLLQNFIIDAITDAKSSKILNDIGRVEFTCSPTSVKAVQWNWNSVGKYEFVLWPLDLAPPFDNPCKKFTFRPLTDVHGIELGRILSSIREGDFKEADVKFRALARLYDRFSDPELSNAVNVKTLRFNCVWAMCGAARDFRRTFQYRNLGEGRDALTTFEESWLSEMVTTSAYDSRDEALARLAESAAYWNQFARDVYVKGLRSWRDIPANSETAFRSDDSRNRLLGDLESILNALYDQNVRSAIDPNIKRALLNPIARTPIQQLNRYAELADKKPEEVSLSNFEELVYAMGWLYPPKRANEPLKQQPTNVSQN